MIYIIVIILYVLNVAPYGINKLFDFNLFSLNIYPNFLLFLEFLFLLIIQIRIIKIRRLLIKERQKEFIKSDMIYALNIIFVTVIFLSYLTNDLILKYIVRDSVHYSFLFALFHIFLLELSFRKSNYYKVIKIFKTIYLFHIFSFLAFIFIKYDLSTILDRVLSNPFKKGSGLMLSFFGGAANEETYILLITFFIYSTLMSTKIKLINSIILFFVIIFTGTRTTFFMYIIVFFIWIYSKSNHFLKKFLILLIPVTLVIFSRGLLLFYLSSAFPFIHSFQNILIFQNFIDSTNLYSRIYMAWTPILEFLLSGNKFIFGLSYNGIRMFTSKIYFPAGDIDSSLHNGFIFYFAMAGLVGLTIYICGFFSMVKSFYLSRKKQTLIGKKFNLEYILSTFIMLIFTLMSNSQIFPGVILYILLISMGYVLRYQSSNKLKLNQFSHMI